MKRFILVLVSLMALAGCREENFLYHTAPPVIETLTLNHKVKDIQGNSAVDILWIIDNSGSMSSHQQNVIANTELFMQNFTQVGGLRWKMGLVSTDEYELPYIGFALGNLLDFTFPDPVTSFQNAVARLGTSGSATEKTFTPLMNALTRYSNFTRPGSVLAIIVVTDAPEQSADYNTHKPDAAEFLNFIKTIKPNEKDFVMYGAFAADDFGCKDTEGWNYVGSPYEEVIKKSNGKTYVLCTPDFGKSLSDLGKNLVSRVTSPRLFLSARPIPETIHIYYKGVELPGGAVESGGLWFYDPENNSVVFHNLDFAIDDTAQVRVSFDEDIGITP